MISNQSVYEDMCDKAVKCEKLIATLRKVKMLIMDEQFFKAVRLIDWVLEGKDED